MNKLPISSSIFDRPWFDYINKSPISSFCWHAVVSSCQYSRQAVSVIIVANQILKRRSRPPAPPWFCVRGELYEQIADIEAVVLLETNHQFPLFLFLWAGCGFVVPVLSPGGCPLAWGGGAGERQSASGSRPRGSAGT